MQLLYENMWQQGLVDYQQGQFSIDKQIGSATDNRRGITLLARLSPSIQQQAAQFLTELNDLCPNQYCYPQSDMHLTLMSIVSCHPGYSFEPALAKQYLAALESKLTNKPSFIVEFTGITVSNAAVLLRGYADQEILTQLRATVRDSIIHSGLAHSMDSRYKIETAHSTVFRYQAVPKDSQVLIEFLQRNKNRSFGSMPVQSLELVFNDWYQSKQETQLIGNIHLD